MKHIIFIFSTLFLLFPACKSSNPIRVSVADFGAVNDGSVLTSSAIQKAIDEVSKQGGGVVEVPSGTYLCGTVLLKQNVTLHLKKGAELIGSHSLTDYQNIDPFTDAVGQQRGNCLVGAKGVKNIGITGEGVINGRGERMVFGKGERSKRPFLVRIVQCENVTIENIEMRNSAAWTLHLFQSKKVKIEHIRLLSQSEQNGDGIDIDSSQDVTITYCDINAHDDAICFKSTSPIATKDCKVKHCHLSSHWGAVKFGTESMGNFENIEVSHCYIYDTHGGGIKILSADGANVKNIYLHDLEMNDVEMPIFIRLGTRLRTYRDSKKQRTGSMDGIRIENISIHGKRYKDWRMTPASTIFVTGIPEAKIKNLSLKNINAKMYFEGKGSLSSREIPENRKKYPEYLKFGGPSPAYGAFIRHAENVSMSNITIQAVNQEERHVLRADDVKQLFIDGLYFSVDKNAQTPLSFNNVIDADCRRINFGGKTTEPCYITDDSCNNIEVRSDSESVSLTSTH